MRTMRVMTISDAHEEGPSAQMQKRDDRDRGERVETRLSGKIGV